MAKFPTMDEFAKAVAEKAFDDYEYDGKTLREWAKLISTGDLVEVVRCKYCRNSMLWRKPTNKVIGECFIRKMNSEDEQFCMVGADDFCSYGERRTDNED